MLRLDLRSRPTTEIVVIMFTLLICVVLIVTVVGITVQKAIHPDQDLSKAGDAVFNMISTIIGALVGFISGRAYGRREERDIKNGDFPTEQKQ
jgi:uncharacterized membrane protein YdjX (TVP38/TMEM64 family)